MDYIERNNTEIDTLAEKIDLSNSLFCLDGLEKTIIFLKFYGGLSQTAIANRLGISLKQLTRLQRIGLGKLKLELSKEMAE